MTKKVECTTMAQNDMTTLLVELAKIQTLQKVSNKEFEDHKKEDKVHFDRIYDTLEEYVVKMSDNTSALRVFETKVLAWVAGISTAGVAISAIVNLYLRVPGVLG